MRPIEDLTAEEATRLEGLFFDLDDTVLSHGVLGRAAYEALWNMHDAGLKLVAVTGRPSGWAEVIVRQWPIHGAVAENGAMAVVRDGRGVKVFPEVSDEASLARCARLEALTKAVADAMPHVHLADDVRARRSDLAWDIGETVTLAEHEIAALTSLVQGHGARTTRSSVHLHASFERDDKASGALRFAQERFGTSPGRAVYTWGFAGDSGNDAPCFNALSMTFGVANVRLAMARLSVPPRYVANLERGDGFAEIARVILQKRRVKP